MPTPAKGPRLGAGPAHERLMLANLATALFEHGRITTTETKAKRLRPYAEKLITFGKRGDLHARRQVLKVLRDKTVVHALFAEIGPRYENRPGGYTRITKLGPRKGDNAPMALIELVEALSVRQSAVGEAERARGTRFAGSRPVTGATAESAAELAGQSPTAAAVAQDVDAGVREQVAADAPETDGEASEQTAVGGPAASPVAQDVDAGVREQVAADAPQTGVEASEQTAVGGPAASPVAQDVDAGVREQVAADAPQTDVEPSEQTAVGGPAAPRGAETESAGVPGGGGAPVGEETVTPAENAVDEAAGAQDQT